MTILHVIKYYHPDIKEINLDDIPDEVFIKWVNASNASSDNESMQVLKHILLEYVPDDTDNSVA